MRPRSGAAQQRTQGTQRLPACPLRPRPPQTLATCRLRTLPPLQAGKRVAVPGGNNTGEIIAKLRKRGVQVAAQLPWATSQDRQQALEVLRSGQIE